MKPLVKGLVREPLVHFLLLGAALFALYQLAGDRSGKRPGQIVVTTGQIEHLAAGFARTWQRLPTPSELQGLIEENIREEVFYREALALGLERDDTVIRRRLRQKLEFIADDLVAQAGPSDAALQGYLAQHPDAFRLEPRFTFRHVYLNPDRRGAALPRDADRLLAELRRAGDEVDAAAVGDGFLLDHEFKAVTQSEVVKAFGEQFAAQLALLTPGVWQGPIASGYGVHLVLVRERTEGRLPALEEVREAVRREWTNAQRLEANERFYQGLRQRYTITVEWSGRPGGTVVVAAEVER